MRKAELFNKTPISVNGLYLMQEIPRESTKSGIAAQVFQAEKSGVIIRLSDKFNGCYVYFLSPSKI
jgi:hypothetical protein